MTLYEYIKQEQNDFDVWDTVFDNIVTVCCIDEDKEDEDNHYKFCIGIMKLVEFKSRVLWTDCAITGDWYGFLKKNYDTLLEWAKAHWREYAIPEDEEDFIYEWIDELHGMFAGGLSEESYADFVENYLPELC